MDIQSNRIKIDKYSSGWVLTIKEKNWTKIIEYATPCIIEYHGRLIELYNDYLIDKGNEYRNEELMTVLPNVLENGQMIPKSK